LPLQIGFPRRPQAARADRQLFPDSVNGNRRFLQVRIDFLPASASYVDASVADAFSEGRGFSAKLTFRQISHLDCLGMISDLLLAAYSPLLSEHIKAASRQNTRKRLSIGSKADRTQVIN
jgi:hypothetical protein